MIIRNGYPDNFTQDGKYKEKDELPTLFKSNPFTQEVDNTIGKSVQQNTIEAALTNEEIA